MYFRRCAACCGFVLSGSTFQWSAVGAVARLRVPPSWVITPTGRTLCWLGPGDVRPLVVFRARTAALAGRSGVMYSWTLVISSTTEMFAERLYSAIYFEPFFSVISSASEMCAEHLGTVSLLWAFDGPDRPDFASGRSFQSFFFDEFTVQLLCMVHDVRHTWHQHLSSLGGIE